MSWSGSDISTLRDGEARHIAFRGKRLTERWQVWTKKNCLYVWWKVFEVNEPHWLELLGIWYVWLFDSLILNVYFGLTCFCLILFDRGFLHVVFWHVAFLVGNMLFGIQKKQCLENSRTHSLRSASNLWATLNPTKRMTPKVEIHLTGIQSVQK